MHMHDCTPALPHLFKHTNAKSPHAVAGVVVASPPPGCADPLGDDTGLHVIANPVPVLSHAQLCTPVGHCDAHADMSDSAPSAAQLIGSAGSGAGVDGAGVGGEGVGGTILQSTVNSPDTQLPIDALSTRARSLTHTALTSTWLHCRHRHTSQRTSRRWCQSSPRCKPAASAPSSARASSSRPQVQTSASLVLQSSLSTVSAVASKSERASPASHTHTKRSHNARHSIRRTYTA
jgi:hypothetical protein